MLAMPRTKTNKNTTYAALGEALTAARLYAGLTQAATAEALGVHRDSILQIEHGERAPRPDELRELMKLYSVNADSKPLTLGTLIKTMHPDDEAILHQLATILRADREYKTRMELWKARQNNQA